MRSRLRPDWSELTQECLIDIFSRLSMEQRWIGPMLVCKTWTKACKDSSLNSVLDLEARFLSSIDTSDWWSPEFGDKVDSILRSVVDCSEGGLKEIRVRHCTDRSISYAADRCPNLEILSVKYCPKVTDDSMWKIALNCLKLKELDISFSYVISCECMIMLGTNCKNLEILKRNMLDPLEAKRLQSKFRAHVSLMDPSILTLGNVNAFTMGRHMHHLKHLELQFCILTDKAFAHLCKECSNLEYLDLLGCRYLSYDGVTNGISSLKNLKEIKKPDPDFSFLFD